MASLYEPADVDPNTRGLPEALAGDGAEHEDAVAELRAFLRRIAGREAARRTGTHGLHGVELDDLADQAANDATVAVLRRLPDFAGRSRFTTWAAKFAILEVAQKIARHHWRRGGVALDPEAWDRLPARLATSPEQVAEARVLVEAIRDIADTELTERQRMVFDALFVTAVGFDVLAIEMGTNRNALYKMEYDIRAKLRRHLVARGLVQEEEVNR